MRSLGWALTQYDRCPSKKGKLGWRRAWREDHLQMQWGGGVYEPRNKVSEEPILLTPWFQMFSPQNCEKINLWCLSAPSTVLSYSSPRRQIHSTWSHINYMLSNSFTFPIVHKPPPPPLFFFNLAANKSFQVFAYTYIYFFKAVTFIYIFSVSNEN